MVLCSVIVIVELGGRRPGLPNAPVVLKYISNRDHIGIYSQVTALNIYTYTQPLDIHIFIYSYIPIFTYSHTERSSQLRSLTGAFWRVRNSISARLEWLQLLEASSVLLLPNSCWLGVELGLLSTPFPPRLLFTGTCAYPPLSCPYSGPALPDREGEYLKPPSAASASVWVYMCGLWWFMDMREGRALDGWLDGYTDEL